MAGGAPMAAVISQMRGQSQGPQGAQFTPLESNPYAPQLPSSQNLNPYSQPSALNQQMARQRSEMRMDPYAQGLQNLYSMFSTQRQPLPMPQYTVPGLNFRPNMRGSQEVLRRVAPSVAEQRRLQAIEDARRAAEEAAAQGGDGGALQSYYDYGGGG